MPFITRNTQHIDTPESLYNPEDDIVDFLNDPDFMRDQLPQPYRRIDKILNELLDDVWEIIEKRDNEKNAELSKPRPSKYENLFFLENIENVNYVCPSSDENSTFLFVGYKGGIAAIDAGSLQVCDQISFDDESQNVLSITCSKLKQSAFLVSAITESQNIHLSVFIMSKLYAVQPLIENESEKRISFKKVELSENSDYMALLVESTTTSTNEPFYIEVYKFAKDLWLQQIETLIDKIYQSTKSTDNIEQTDTLGGGGGDLNNAINNQTNVDKITFQKPTLFCKIKPPPTTIQPANTLNLGQILKATENADVIGVGINHCISKHHLDLKKQLAERIYNVELDENTIPPNSLDIKFKFSYANRFISAGFTEQEIPNSLMVCWNDSNQLLFYPFTKMSKELEAKIECCLPFTSEITHIEVTKNNTLIAIALKNKNIVILDTISGVERKCVHLHVNSIKSMHFLPTFLSANERDFFNNDFQYKIQTNLICLADDGKIFVVDCTLSNTDPATLIYAQKFKNNDDKFCLLTPCKYLPNLVFVSGVTNKLYLLDVKTETLVCELDNPSMNVQELNQNEISFACRNKFLFVKCVDKKSQKSKLFAHSLRLIPKLDDYFTQNEIFYTQNNVPNCTINDRMKLLMKQRISEQYQRKERLLFNWNKLHEQRNNLTA